jgi:hypothetical protein
MSGPEARPITCQLCGTTNDVWTHLGYCTRCATWLSRPTTEVLGYCPHGVDLDRAFCADGCRV